MTGAVDEAERVFRGSAILAVAAHRPWPLPKERWAIHMFWTELLFAHWPIAHETMRGLVPRGLEVDTYQGTAWVGLVPFRMEGVRVGGLPRVPGTASFLEANVRTYVVDPKTGQRGVYFFSLDAENPLAVLAARAWYRLPYFWAGMRLRQEADGWRQYRSERLFAGRRARLETRYRGSGRPATGDASLARFLTERYALFTSGRQGKLMRADVHHLPWPLEDAEARFEDMSVARAQGIELPFMEPILHYSRELEVFAWTPRGLADSARA